MPGNVTDLFTSNAFDERTIDRIVGIRNASLNDTRLFIRIRTESPVAIDWLRRLVIKADIPKIGVSGAAEVRVVRPYGELERQLITGPVTALQRCHIPLPSRSTLTIVMPSGRYREFIL